MKASFEFQVFAKPAGPACNLACDYCYYLGKESALAVPEAASTRMAEEVLEVYVVQHIEAHPGASIGFSWHGGEPTILGLDYFRNVVALQQKHRPPGRKITNGIQTNGVLLDDAWCRFLAAEGFTVGLSLDGPRQLHDLYRVTRGRGPTHEHAMRGYQRLRRHGVPCDVLCVVHAGNVSHPLEVYRFFRQIGAQYVGLLPLVERRGASDVTERSVSAEAYGAFLCAIFDEWLRRDTGRMRVQIFEEAARTALGREHALCIFRPTCGEIPVVEHDGGFYSCDHFVDPEHRLGNIRQTLLVELLESPRQLAFGRHKLDSLPRQCRACEVLAMCHGGCPKNRFSRTAEGEAGLNHLCEGYRRFFTHSRPYFEQAAAVVRQQELEPIVKRAAGPPARPQPRVGRNEPCPCGSGRKYKRCCADPRKRT